MRARSYAACRRLVVVTALAATATLSAAPPQDRPTGQGFTFHTGVEFISVAATVTDANGRFVSGLKRDDFVVYEDGKLQEVSQFDSERVPVSLGIALDTSGSMLGEKFSAAKAALNRFLVDLLGPQDEVFLYRFDSRPELVQPWTTDRAAASRTLASVQPKGGTAMYDTIAEAVPIAQAGTRRKKALVVISDGNDTSSHTQVPELQRAIRESEVLVYAIGIDASDGASYAPSSNTSTSKPAAVPAPFPGRKPVTSSPTPVSASGSSSSASTKSPPASRMPGNRPSTDRVNADALRAITDDSGGRTEIIVSHRDLDPMTAGIADELSRQYFLGYNSSIPKDGKWHTIEVQVRRQGCTVRARKGFIAG